MECSLKRISMIKRKKFALFTDTNDKHYTFEEYQTLIKDNQTDKDGNLIYLYANNKDEQYSYIEAATNQRIQCLAHGWPVRCSYGKYVGAKA